MSADLNGGAKSASETPSRFVPSRSSTQKVSRLLGGHLLLLRSFVADLNGATNIANAISGLSA
ncbi:hypothetical protein B9L19_05280 [Geobacillus thermocatenulatus]|uniref:Uncharacterized protein n=1 Tax=Geobacillus thermocatenulatus TaxID=33938 RepID=A0A226QCS7_9BACL|nr:hypothetical protein GT3921_06520 [Geobacillus thermocatenulatus]KLR73897.1 hypothetical protein ABH20_08680 [Geobacillus sp. T6]OXB89477.1 hypothetical protein B9L19_05280 [Geobacillus thermocatenulatus]RAN22676.1 hypothetical protein VC88_10040 [Geobacillus sp. A8]